MIAAESQSAKLGIWLFLAADSMFFLGLIGAFMVLRSGRTEPAASGLSGATMGMNFILLLGGSLAVVIAEQRNRPAILSITFLAAAGFLAVTFHSLVLPELPTDGFHACCLTLTAVHALHVAAAMIVILILLTRGKFASAQIPQFRTFWHFVVVMWILLFPILLAGT